MAERITYYNLPLDLHDTASALESCTRFFESETIHNLYFINAHCFNLAQKNNDYFHAVREADMILNDGAGIELGARLAGIRLRENMNGTDFTPELLKLAAKMDKKVFLLGSREEVIQRAKHVLEKKYTGLTIAGVHHGFFSSDQEKHITETINRSGAELLLVGMGVPRQELWIHRNRKELKNIKIAAAVGAAVEFMAGEVKRAPVWMRRIRMEWFYRFLREPARMFSRYFIGNFVFGYHVLRMRKRL